MPLPQVGKKAPAFTLPAIPSGKVRLSQFRGDKNVVLYFYPRDNTPGCTQEACDFRDQIARVQDSDTVVLGISGDSIASHEKFAAKHELPFQLLADEDHSIAEKYGVWVEKKNYGKTYFGIQRATFLIDKQGTLVEIWPKVKVKGHVDEVIEKLNELQD
ncbi:putative peroxiredoxin bcp [Thalassoglobus neptunius]|uniref:thioredoxin-dependent peroxiredoxin n=1 Tax=Thalassoglobus neptunius TaxID=1938619 RepID=A0A5C5X435_9PLAN|nr:thioredoxin-dependent thiol peroxidase [Thalassoglobus neptunius]TWT57630.1 putative peroxiredoxin bcp [Thalassoglobus neptunius]